MAGSSVHFKALLLIWLQTRRATKTARRLVQEIGYQAQRLYDDADRSYNSETVWEGRLVGRMKELDIKTESQVKIREYFKEYIPQPKFADILLEQKVILPSLLSAHG